VTDTPITDVAKTFIDLERRALAAELDNHLMRHWIKQREGGKSEPLVSLAIWLEGARRSHMASTWIAERAIAKGNP